MPYIEVKLSIKLDNNQKNDLQIKLCDIVSETFSKPKTYIMTEIEDNCSLFMAGKRVENGAYISIKLYGTTTKDKCNSATKEICRLLSSFGIEDSKVYTTFHPVELWGWNGMMF